MVKCPTCNAIIKPSSMEYHDRLHKMEAEAKERMPEIDVESIDLGPRGKRKAAEKYVWNFFTNGILQINDNIFHFFINFRAVTKISEFTALVKDDKDNEAPSSKKLKLSTCSMVRHCTLNVKIYKI